MGYTIPMETATLAGGCFWCTEAIFRRLKGVTDVMPGYCQEAEAIQFTFDPKIISFRKLLEIFFHMHDPTTRNRQGNDVGLQYRSVIFYHTEAQKKDAEIAKSKIAQAVTEIVPYTNFYAAEESHQEYYEKNSYQPYCQLVIDPKLQKLLKEYRSEVKHEYIT